MDKEFKPIRLLGNRIYLEIPPMKESPIVLSEADKEMLVAEERKKYSRLTVYAVGDLVTSILEGDEVLTDPAALQRAPMIPLSDEKTVLLVSVFDIVHVWQ
jgi:hypothetical protein